MIGPTETIQSGSVDFKDLVKIDDLYYKKFTGAPFTGKVTGQEQGYLKKGNWGRFLGHLLQRRRVKIQRNLQKRCEGQIDLYDPSAR